MNTPFYHRDDDPDDDEIVYEPLDDGEWIDPDDLTAIDVTEEELAEDDVIDEDDAAYLEDAPENDAEEIAEEAAEAAADVAAPGAAAAPETDAAVPAADAPDEAPPPEDETPPAPPGRRVTFAQGVLLDLPDEDAAPEPSPAEMADAAAEDAEAGEETDALRCRVVFPLPEALRAQIAALRGEHALNGAAPDALELIAPFGCADLAALEDTLAAWAAERLPIAATLAKVSAEVVGARRYVAGWEVAPGPTLIAAQQALARALEALGHFDVGDTDDTDDAPVFEPRLVVADDVPPHVFPHLVAAMQRDFAPQLWTLDAIALQFAAPGGAPGWQVRALFP